MSYTLKINGETREVDVEAGTPLLWVLRDELKLTGTKFGCGVAFCGACTVHLNGNPTRSCVLPIEAVGESEVTTIEGATSDTARAVQTAWVELDVVQCGYCQSGQIMQAVGLLSQNQRPSDAEIDAHMQANICRCATYPRIRAAVQRAASLLES